jgi:hypothetical protein
MIAHPVWPPIGPQRRVGNGFVQECVDSHGERPSALTGLRGTGNDLVPKRYNSS